LQPACRPGLSPAGQASSASAQQRSQLIETVTLTSANGEIQREVEAGSRADGIFTIKDGSRYVQVTLDGDGDLRVEMVDERKNLILTNEENQPNRDLVTATLQTD